jgi:hypothetical protein
MASDTAVPHSAINSCPIRADDTLGPVVVGPCRQHFDFTLMFEQSIMSIGPSSILLFLVPLALYGLSRSEVKTISHRPLYTGKAVSSPTRFAPITGAPRGGNSFD